MCMNDCKKKCDCNCKEKLHCLKYEVDTNHNILMSILGKHIHDMSMHVSEEDRQYWNSKADREQIRGIEDAIKERVEQTTREIINNVAHEVVEDVTREVVNTVTHEVVEHEVERVEMNIDWNYQNLVTPNEIAKANERTKIGKLTINGNTVEIFQAPAPMQEIPTPQPVEPTVIENPYNDEEVRQLIQGLRDDLNEIHDWSQEEIDNMVDEIISGYNFIDGWQAGWDDKIKAYLIRVGVLGEDGVSKGWSYLEVKYDEIAGVVNNLIQLVDPENGEINYETLQAMMKQQVRNGIAELDLNTKWALLDADHEELEWMMSGFRSQSSQYESFAEMYSTGLTQNNNELTAAIRTEVNNKLATAKTEMGAQVDDKLAGYVAYSDLDHAVATMFADDGESTAYVETAVQNGISSATVNADKVYIDGQTLVNYLNENMYDAEGVKIEQSSITVDRNMDEDNDAVVITPGRIDVSNYRIDQHNNTITPGSISFYDPTVGTTTYGIEGISSTDTYNLSSGISFNGDGVTISGSISTKTPEGDTYSTVSGDYEISSNLYLHVVNGLIVAIDDNPTL